MSQLCFVGSHHYANLLAKATGSKVKGTGTRQNYKVEGIINPQAYLIEQGFNLTTDNKDDECVEQTWKKEQPDHSNKSARLITAFYIKFHDEETGSIFFNQDNLG